MSRLTTHTTHTRPPISPIAPCRAPPQADEKSIEADFRAACRTLTADLARKYADRLADHGAEPVKVSIVDPHGPHFADALPKLRGLAEFAETHGDSFHRIESVARLPGDTLRVLDFMEPSVREGVAEAQDAEELYLGDAGEDY